MIASSPSCLPAQLSQIEIVCSIHDELVEESSFLLGTYNPLVFMTSPETSLKNRISEMRMLKPNWDGYGAAVPSEEVIKNAFRFLDTLEANKFLDILDSENIVPTPYGTIDVDFETVNGLVSIEIGKKQLGFFTEFVHEENFLSDGIETDFKSIPPVLAEALFTLKETSKKNDLCA